MAPMDDVQVSAFDIVGAVSQALAQICKAVENPPATPLPFDAVRLPAITVSQYARRLEQYFRCSEECYVLSVVYIERVLQGNPSFVVNTLNVHRLLLAATILSSKVQDDDFFSNAYYAKVGGVNCDELMSLEAHMMKLLEWRAHVSEDAYRHCLERLQKGFVWNLQPSTNSEVPQAPEYVDMDVDMEVVDVDADTVGVFVGTPCKAAKPKIEPPSTQKIVSVGAHARQWPCRGPRRRSTTPVTHMRRTRMCLVAH
jgi:hypothetical protein